MRTPKEQEVEEVIGFVSLLDLLTPMLPLQNTEFGKHVDA